MQAQTLTLRGADIALAGRPSAIEAALAGWNTGAGGTWVPSKLVVDESRIVWQRALGDTVELDADRVHLETELFAGARELRARSDDVTVVLPGATFGPWRVDVDRMPNSARARVAFDPGVPDACTLLIVADDERTTSVDLTTFRGHRSPASDCRRSSSD